MEKNDAFYKSFPFTLLATILIAAVLWIVFDQMYGLSFALGSMTMLFTMSMLHKSSKKIIEYDKVSAQRLAIRNYVFRYTFYAIVLVAAALSPSLDIISTAAGLFLFKIIFLSIVFFDRRGEHK